MMRVYIDTLNNLEATILRILEAHQGKEFAISRADLVWKIDGDFFPLPGPLPQGEREIREAEHYGERKIRETIKHLVTQHGIAIGSCHDGYFMAITAQEIEDVCKYYDSYGLSSLFVSAKLRKIEMREYLGQLSMKFGG